ncbi:DUF1800 domain-containing protein [Neptunicella sp. SCSIO 80796]|uniref:DUF1800 domain-containing protein n=1 Tax=Neptunicella plasticusilytica TaxID=3117012 RepID=UPI003A4DC31F
MSLNAVIATNRFGLGARPGEQAEAETDPKAWLLNQLKHKPPVSFDTSLPSSDEIAQRFGHYRQVQKRQKNQAVNIMANDELEADKKFIRQTFNDLYADTLNAAISSSQSLNWRLLDFFSNHFSVSGTNLLMRGLAGTLEREAIAPHLSGHFSDMLLAVTRHPAMLIYLNNERSFGPSSRLGKKGKGLNENLAREILELHTLGVNGGYSQRDVVELAKGITGWSVANYSKNETGGFIYRKAGHEPGERLLLGKRYPQKEVEQGKAMLVDIARHPATAKHLCFKLVRHFISDTPPVVLVDKLVATWNQTEGDLSAVIATLINAEESWQTQAQKFKTPREFVISTYRAIGVDQVPSKQLLQALTILGQQPFRAGSPAGYSDEQSDWNGSSALMSRIDWSSTLAARAKTANAEHIMQGTLANSVSRVTYSTVLRAESRQQSLALLLMSPEFQRR